MKKLAIILAVLLVTPLVAAADQEKVNYYTPYYAQGNVIPGKKVEYAEKNSKVYKQKILI